MKNLRTLLEESDPLSDEPSLSTTDAREIRRAMLGAVETMSAVFFPRALPVAALVVVMVVAGTAAGKRLSVRAPIETASERAGARSAGSSADPADPANPANSVERRQVRFATPGGTRIIWTIDPNFQMREVMP
jgi:hypothetical protein